MNRLTRMTILPWSGPKTGATIFGGFLIFVVCVDLFSLFLSFTPWSWRMAITLIQAGLLTAVVFRSLLVWFWKHKMKRRFWAFYLFFLALHYTFWGWFLLWFDPRGDMPFSIRVFAICAVVEVMVMASWIWLTTVDPCAWPWWFPSTQAIACPKSSLNAEIFSFPRPLSTSFEEVSLHTRLRSIRRRPSTDCSCCP